MYMYPYISHLFRCFIQKWSPVLRNDTESAIDSIPIKSFQKKSALRSLQTACITIQFVLNDHMLIAGKLVETVNQKSSQAFRSLSSFGFSALWSATDTKGLFTCRWGTPDRWGNRELRQQRRRRLRKRHSKSEVAPLLTLSRLFHLVQFVKCW